MIERRKKSPINIPSNNYKRCWIYSSTQNTQCILEMWHWELGVGINTPFNKKEIEEHKDQMSDTMPLQSLGKNSGGIG